MASPSSQVSSSSDSPAKAEPSLLRRLNEEKVISVLRGEGALTRAEIVRRTGLSHPTVSKIVGELFEASMVEEGELKQPDLGRPGKTVALANRESRVFSLVIGAHRCSLIPSGLDGVLQQGEIEVFSTPNTYAGLLKKVTGILKDRISNNSARVLGLGICLPGLLDAENETVLLSPNLLWLEGKQVGLDLEKNLGFPAVLVPAMAAHYLFESRHGGARGMEDFVVVNYAGGLGIAACNGGRLVDGRGGLAGELGHITVDAEGELCGCGNRGCLETIASDRAVLNAVSKRMGNSVTLSELIERVRSGDREFDDIFEHAGRYLAIGLAAAVNIFNPQAIFIYGKFLAAQDGLFERVVVWTDERSLKLSSAQCEIYQPARDPHECQQIGAAAAIIEKLTQSVSNQRGVINEKGAA
ncbi:MAG: ROK family transcriptional regulator [Verrucomicrobiota bacterium]